MGEGAGPEVAKPAVTRDATSFSSKLNLCVIGCGRRKRLCVALENYKMLSKHLQPCEASAMPVVTYTELNIWPSMSPQTMREYTRMEWDS